MSSFGFSTTGKEVAQAFADKVKGRTFLVTGPSKGGVGSQTALSLASQSPALLILAGRNASRIQPVVDAIKSEHPDVKVEIVHLDTASLSSVRAAAEAVKSLTNRVDVIINNAAIMGRKEYGQSPDGIELQFATNHVGHFLLTKLLLPLMPAGGRIVNVASFGYMVGPVRFEDSNFENGATYDPWLAYAQSKCANILFSLSLADKLKARGIYSFSTNPGLVLETNLQANVPPELFQLGIQRYQEAFQGREPPPREQPKPLVASDSTLVVAALDDSILERNGALLADCHVVEKMEPQAVGLENAERLWKLSEELIGEKFEI